MSKCNKMGSWKSLSLNSNCIIINLKIKSPYSIKQGRGFI